MIKPKAHVDKKTSAMNELYKMCTEHPKLYEECLDTLGFAYSFSQLANRAVHFDYLVAKGLIPSDYFEEVKHEKETTTNN